jgi:hypothetical protein
VKSDNAAVGAVIFLFGGVTTVLSLQMPIGTFRMAGTGMFPLCLGVTLMILSGIFLFQILVREKPVRAKTAPPGSSLNVVVFIGAMVLVTMGFGFLGYPVSAFLLMAILLRGLGMKRWTWTLALSSATAVVCYFLFVLWLQIPLPKGWVGI